jgi:cytochrome P450
MSSVPRGLPLLGHAVSLVRDPLAFFRRMREHGPMVPIRVGPMSAYVVNDPELVRQILVTGSRQYDKGSIFEKAARCFGNGLALSTGELHRTQRRHIQPAFHQTRLADYADIMIEVAAWKVGSWRPGARLDLMVELEEVTLTTVARTLFSTDIGEAAVQEIRHSMPLFLKEITWRTLSPFPLLERLPTPRNRRFDRGIADMRAAILHAVAGYRRTDADQGDLLSILVAPDRETGTRMSDEQVHDEVLTLMMTGTETSATTLAWAFHHLSTDPVAQRRFHTELDEVLAGGEVTMAVVARLPYLRRVLQEALRLHGFPLLPRRALTEVSVGGRTYPPGTQFFMSPYAMHRDPTYFPDPDCFDPDRWLPERATPARHVFIPFGSGVHKCIGDSYAWNDMAIIAATIGSCWRLAAVAGAEVRETMAGVARPSQVPVVAHPRSP